MPIHGAGNAPLQSITPGAAPSAGTTTSGRPVRQEPAQEKRGIFSFFQRSQAAPSTQAGKDATQIPVSKPITARTVFSSLANIKMLATIGYTATAQTLKKEQCLQELGALKEQRVALKGSKAPGQAMRQIDDAIGERSKSISAKDWVKIFGNDSGLLMSMPKNSPVRQDFVLFNLNYHTEDTILFLQAANDPANLTPEGMDQLFNKHICVNSPYQANVSGKIRNTAIEQLYAMQTQGDTSAGKYKAILAPVIEEMEKVINKDVGMQFGKSLAGKYEITEIYTPANAPQKFDELARELPDKDLLTLQLQQLQNIDLRADKQVSEDLFEGNAKLKIASKDSLFGDNAAGEVRGLDDASLATGPTPARAGDAGVVARHPILSQMGEAMANRSIAALSDRPVTLLVDFAKTLASASASQEVPQSLAELQSGNVRGEWENYVDTLGSTRDAGNALSNVRGQLLDAKRMMLSPDVDNPVVGGALDTMIGIVEQRLSGAPASSARPASARTDIPREAMVTAADPLRANPMTAQRQWIDSMGGKDNVKLGDILNLPAQHPMRISLREGMAAHFQADSFIFLETLRNEPQMDLGRARQVVDQQLSDINLPFAIQDNLISRLGGTVTLVYTPDPNGGPADYLPKVTWKPADTVAAAMPAGGWAKVFDPAVADITSLLSTTNFKEVMEDPSYFP